MADAAEMRSKFFAQKRQDLNSDATRQEQAANDVIQRRFTAMGQANSGAAIGATLGAQKEVNDTRQKAINALSGDELQAQIQGQDVLDQRNFQSNEAKLGRDFQSAESKVGREFQGGLADKDAALKTRFFDTEQGNKLKEMDLAERQFAMDKDTTEFNKRMAEIEANREPAGLLGQGGIMGTGIGGSKGIGGTGGLSGPSGKQMAFVANPIATIANGGGCFLTTAATEAMGLSDDCWVLNEARRFRDTYMVQTPERAAEIMEYYHAAPMVADGINALDDAKRVWKQLFWQDIIPFVDAVRKDDFETAHTRYVNLIARAKTRAKLKEA